MTSRHLAEYDNCAARVWGLALGPAEIGLLTQSALQARIRPNSRGRITSFSLNLRAAGQDTRAEHCVRGRLVISTPKIALMPRCSVAPAGVDTTEDPSSRHRHARTRSAAHRPRNQAMQTVGHPHAPCWSRHWESWCSSCRPARCADTVWPMQLACTDVQSVNGNRHWAKSDAAKPQELATLGGTSGSRRVAGP